MKRWLFFSLALVMLSVFIPTTSQAITIGFDPVSQEVYVGSPADVELVISGLGNGTWPSVGIFDLDISFDPSILDFASATFGDPVLGDQLDIWDLGGNPMDASITSPGVLNIYEVSLDLPWDLDDFQADSFTLATLTFDTLAVGTSSLDISINALGDAWGDPLSADVLSGSISPIPEPSTMLLVSCGLVGLVGFRRRFRR